MKINSSLIIQNVTVRDLDNYSCVAINSGGMAECKISLALLQVNFWSDTLEEIIIILTILGAIIAVVFSVLMMRLLARRKTGGDGSRSLVLCSRSVSGCEDSVHQSLIHNSVSVSRSLADTHR